jgi:hypothetical protein
MSNLMAINQTTPPDPTTTDSIPGDFNEFDFLQIELDRAGVLQQNLELQGEDIKKNNALLSDLQSVLKVVDAATPTGSTSDTPITSITVPQDAWNEIYDNGQSQLPLSNATQNPNGTVTFDCGSVQKLSAFLKDDVQQLSNNSQMDMIQLQSQMNNLNQVMQTATSVMQKASDTKDKILQNIH